MIIQKRPINKMLAIMCERADESWPAMYKTPHYARILATLAKSNDEITYVDKETVGSDLKMLCLALGLNYYNLLMKVYQE